MRSDDVSVSLDPVNGAAEAATTPAVEWLFAQMAAAMDRMQQGTLLVDEGGQILFANRQARELLAAGNGLSHSASGALQAETSEQAHALRRLIAGAACGDGAERAVGMMAVKRRDGRRPLALVVASCHTRTSFAAALRPRQAILIFVTDPDRPPTMRADQLRQLYRLTRTEADVALAVLRGEGLKAIADSFGISLSTVLTHLQNVFDKTETRRQAELVHLLLRSVPDVDVV